MRRLWVIVVAAVGLSAGAVAQEVDVYKAVRCQALAQQFGDSVKTAEVEDAARTAATELAEQGDQACNQHNYDAGMDQLRRALQLIGLAPSR